MQVLPSGEAFTYGYQLPLKLDVQSHSKYSTISWKPIKDLLRNVINKREDGTDIRPQEGNPGTVHVWPEAGGLCGYAMGTLQKRKHALRALGWLGGNSWYGRPLSVILYYDGFNGLQYVDSCCEPRDGANPIKLEDMVSVSQKELLQWQPSRDTPNMLLCLVPKGSTISHAQGPDAGYGMGEGETWALARAASWTKRCRTSQDYRWHPSEIAWTEDGMSFSGGHQPYPAPCLNMLPLAYSSVPIYQACSNNHQTSKPLKWRHRQRNYLHIPSAGSARPPVARIGGKLKDEVRAFPDQESHVSSSRPPSSLNASDWALEECMQASECADRSRGPVIADGSEVDFNADDERSATNCTAPTTTS